jgi:hypothetical protein
VSSSAPDFEALLREALRPVEPSDDLAERLELTLISLTAMAQEELDSWELSAMRDPRNWVRPAAAVLAGGAAGTALVLLRARRRAQEQSPNLEGLRAAGERALRELSRETRKLLDTR